MLRGSWRSDDTKARAPKSRVRHGGPRAEVRCAGVRGPGGGAAPGASRHGLRTRPPPARLPRPTAHTARRRQGAGARAPVCFSEWTIKFRKFEKGGKIPPTPLWPPERGRLQPRPELGWPCARGGVAGARGWGSRWTCTRCTSTPSSRWSPAFSERYPPRAGQAGACVLPRCLRWDSCPRFSRLPPAALPPSLPASCSPLRPFSLSPSRA